MVGPKYYFESHVRPGTYWTQEQKDRARLELILVGKATLLTVPNYQCFSDSPTAFDDKIIIMAREESPQGRLVAFVSTILLPIDDDTVGPVLHTGLTCVLPEKQRQGFQVQLFHRLQMLLCQEYPEGIWFTSISGCPASLVGLAFATVNVFPSPEVAAPQDAHRRIARAISCNHRAALDVPTHVVFDEEDFVFQENAPPGSPWYKDPTDPKYQHRHVAMNDYYVDQLLAQPLGSEILQVGFMDPKKVVYQARCMRS